MMQISVLLFSALLSASAFNIMNKEAMPYFYPVGYTRNMKTVPLQKLYMFEQPLACYENKNETLIVHSDICPHQGASLSRGWVNQEGNLQCPYHGFEFCSGMFCKIPNPICKPSTFRSKIIMPVYPTIHKNGMTFVSPVAFDTSRFGKLLPEPFFPPEEYDPGFRSVQGSRIISSNYMSVCENLLDMLHISYVHSFGNSISPLPYEMRYVNLTEKTSGRSEFLYRPREFTISNKMGKVTSVVVQNEFHLPTNTVTRVTAGPVVKTVFTQSLPISSDKTLLFWKVYRNFWVDPYIRCFSTIGDILLKFLMEKTIDEDVDMLKNVYATYRTGRIKTKYDITIHHFRHRVTQTLTQFAEAMDNNQTQQFLESHHHLQQTDYS